MNLRGLLGGLFGKRRIIRETRPMRVTPWYLGHGLTAAELAGSGYGIGIQAKGTAVIHSRERLPHNNLELFSNAPITRLEHYKGFGANAAAYALGEMPEPVVVPTRGEAMGSRYHARVALIYAIETGLTAEGAAPEDIEVKFTGVKS